MVATFYGGNIINEFELNTSGFLAQDKLEQIKNDNGEAIIVIPSAETVDQALQVVNANDRKLPVIGEIGNLYGMKTLEAGGEDAVGMAIPIPWHIDHPGDPEFVETAQDLWGGGINWATVMTYDAMSAIAQGLEQSPNPSRESLKQALSAKDFSAPGVVEPVEFLPSGDRDGELIMVEVQPRNPSRSGTGYDFVPVDHQEPPQK